MPTFHFVLPRRWVGARLPRGLVLRLLFFTAAWVAVLSTARGEAEAMPRSSIVVGITSADRRFVTAEQAGDLGAYEAALSVAVARTQGLRVSFQLAPFNELLRELAAGRIDTIPGMARTPERLRSYDFTVAHNRMNTNLFVRRGDRRIHGLEDLPGKRIIVVGGSYSQEWAEKRGYRGFVVQAPDLVEAVRRLERGEGDCLIAKQINIFSAMRSLGMNDVVPAGPPIAELQTELHFGVRAGDRVLLAQLNEGLFTLKQTGELDRLYEEWLGVLDPSSTWLSRHGRILLVVGASLLALLGGAWLVQRVQTRRTKRRLAEIEREVQRRTDELAAAKARFEAVVAHTPAAIVLVEADADLPLGRIVDCNEAACRLYGHERTKLLGTAYGSLWEHPPGVGRWNDELAAMRRAGRHHAHARHRRLDGRLLEMELFCTAISLEGRELLLAMGIDVTDRIQAEAALRRTEEQQRLVLQATNDGIFDWDLPADRFVMSTRGKELLGLDETTPVNRRQDWWQRLHPEDATVADLALQRHLHAGAPFSHTARFRHRDGSVRWLYGRAQTLRDAHGAPLRMIGSFTDVTELKRIDEELQLTRRLRAVGELVGGIAHEFNNLLTPILLQTSELTSQKDLPPDLEPQLRPVLDAARRAQALTRQLLQLSRQQNTERHPESLATVIEGTLGLVRSTLDRRIQITLRCEPELPVLMLNATTMGQVVMNLLLNARDALLERLAAPPHAGWRPAIEIVLERHTGTVPARRQSAGSPRNVEWLRLTVRDNGPGIPPEIRSRVFEPFFTTKKVGEGTGLGLAMVWTSVEELGGWIELDAPPAGGTEFRLHFPGDPALAAANGGTTPTSVLVPAAQRRRLLLVDDDPLVGSSIAQLLRKLGHEAAWVQSGEIALQRLQSPGEHGPAPDALVTDLNMAGVAGEELVERARRGGYVGKIVVISGHITPQAEQRLRLAGVEALLPKPFELLELRKVFEKLWP